MILEHANEAFDPRHIGGLRRTDKFRFSVKGRILTITRIDKGDEGWESDFWLRAYLPTEDIPDFTSTVYYTYWGLDGEEVPDDTTEVNFHPSVTTIQASAFRHCKSLVRVTIPDTATHIEEEAFIRCVSLRFIRLSINLVSIGNYAFYKCESVEAVFLPPTVTHIHDRAFYHCTSLRICILPGTIDHIGDSVFYGCDRLLTTVNYEFDDEDEDDPINNVEVNEWLMQRYANLPFHQACFSISITPQVIVHGIERATEVDDEQMTALHILCLNPHVTGDCIRTYLQLAPDAAEQQDLDGMTPFQRLCRNDMTFIDDRSFSSLMAWWYGCMPPQTETGKKRKRG